MVAWHRLEYRTGLIYGPFNPVYGFGAVIMTLCLHKLSKKNDMWVFIGGMLIGGAFEYLCSWVQEVLVGTVSWEYSQTPLNLGGRTNLLYSLFWGILSLCWVKWGYPLLSCAIEKIPNRWGKAITWVLVVYMAANMAISGLAVSRQTDRHMGIPPANAVSEFLDIHYPDSFLEKFYPNMRNANDRSFLYQEGK